MKPESGNWMRGDTVHSMLRLASEWSSGRLGGPIQGPQLGL